MPFNVFGSAHKKSFLKWYSKLTGEPPGQGVKGAAAGGGGPQRTRAQVIDASLETRTVTLMNGDGDTCDVTAGPAAAAKEEETEAEELEDLVAKVCMLFAEGGEVEVEIEGDVAKGHARILALL